MQENTAKMQSYPEDSVILREGELKDEMYKIVSGKAAVYINYGKENEYLLGILSEQQCFGELGILCRQPSMYTVVAVYDVLVMRIDKDEFAEFVQNNTRNALAIIRNLSWCMVNLKGNLDLVLEELSDRNATEVMDVNKLKEKFRQSALSSFQKTDLFNQTDSVHIDMSV